MRAPRLIAITDTSVCDENQLQLRAEELCSACRPGSVVVQLRDRDRCIGDRLRIGQRLARIAGASCQILSVNDRVDLALALGAQGVHLGESSVDAVRIRSSFGDRFWITRASHQPTACQSFGADAILLSPVCSPRKGAPSLGLEALARACAATDAPIYALGGVSAENAEGCLASGAAGVAVIGAWLGSESLQPLIDTLRIARST